jgi:hypothetical protein
VETTTFASLQCAQVKVSHKSQTTEEEKEKQEHDHR